jgi:hypothetical protein
MAGYAVECLLKAKLMQMYDCRTLRELEDELQRRGVLAEHATVFTHHLELLLRLTQRLDQLRQHRTLWPQFALVNRWIPAWRYTAEVPNRQDAATFLEAVTQIVQWIEHNV